MNVLDENIIDPQCQELRKRRVSFRQIGHGVGFLGMSDSEVIPLLHGLSRPTFFTQDDDYFKRQLCHSGYCLVYLSILPNVVADYIRRVLKHPELNTRAKRMGFVLSASPDKLSGWRVHQGSRVELTW